MAHPVTNPYINATAPDKVKIPPSIFNFIFFNLVISNLFKIYNKIFLDEHSKNTFSL